MKNNYRGFICAGILGCILVLLTTPLLAQKPVNKNTTSTTSTPTVTDPCDGRVCGMLKVCKVAGYGIPPGTVFQFTDSSTGPSLPIIAGPAPGNCRAVLLPQGTVTITETNFSSLGDAVSNIDVVPAANIAALPNLSAGTVSVKILNNEVTEVTYTDHSQKAGGYLEICKKVENNTVPLPGGYTFTVPRVSGPVTVTVKAGYCSPPLEVPVGTWTITETAVPGTQLVSCSVFPSGTCGHVTGTWTVTVTVPPSVLSQQTVVTIIDGPK
jgi:hypothetical protein